VNADRMATAVGPERSDGDAGSTEGGRSCLQDFGDGIVDFDRWAWWDAHIGRPPLDLRRTP
jgi:hypothetical protein